MKKINPQDYGTNGAAPLFGTRAEVIAQLNKEQISTTPKGRIIGCGNEVVYCSIVSPDGEIKNYQRKKLF